MSIATLLFDVFLVGGAVVCSLRYVTGMVYPRDVGQIEAALRLARGGSEVRA